MGLKEIFEQQIKYARDSGLTIEVDDDYCTVSMQVEGEDLCFMQGQEAEEFAAEVQKLYDREDYNLTWEEAELICGGPYLALAH